MSLRVRMALAVGLIFGLLFAGLMAIAEVFVVLGVVSGAWIIALMVGMTLLFIVLEWGLSPYLLGWLFKIAWVDELPRARRTDRVGAYIERASAEAGVRPPRFGIVRDDNPNAFCYGWTRNRSRLVLTRGMFKYCDDDEVQAVAAHEMGHIVHNDFVVMTLVVAVPLLFYSIYQGCVEAMKNWQGSGGEGDGAAALAVMMMAVISYLVYISSYLASLLVSRFREYWADDYSAYGTRRPDKLASALVKVAYGLAEQGRGKGKAEAAHTRQECQLMLFSPSSARALAVQAAAADGTVTPAAVKDAMSWDLWNPWAFFYELAMTHPLPAKRIVALGKRSREIGQEPYVEFDLVRPRSYWPLFLRDVGARWSWLVAVPVALVAWLVFDAGVFQAMGLLLAVDALTALVYLVRYRYDGRWRSATVRELVRDPSAGPVKGIPVRLEGKVVGRGVPGLWFDEDLKLDDGTGLLLIDSRTIMPFVDLLQGLFKTKDFVGKDVKVRGWFRRGPVPMLELRRIEGPGVSRSIRRPYVHMALLAVLAAIGLVLMALMPVVHVRPPGDGNDWTVSNEGAPPGWAPFGPDGLLGEEAEPVATVRALEGWADEGRPVPITLDLEGPARGGVELVLTWQDNDMPEVPEGRLGLAPVNGPDTMSLVVETPSGRSECRASANEVGEPGSVTIRFDVPSDATVTQLHVTVECVEAGDLVGGVAGRRLMRDSGNDWTLAVSYAYVPYE